LYSKFDFLALYKDCKAHGFMKINCAKFYQFIFETVHFMRHAEHVATWVLPI